MNLITTVVVTQKIRQPFWISLTILLLESGIFQDVSAQLRDYFPQKLERAFQVVFILPYIPVVYFSLSQSCCFFTDIQTRALIYPLFPHVNVEINVSPLIKKWCFIALFTLYMSPQFEDGKSRFCMSMCVGYVCLYECVLPDSGNILFLQVPDLKETSVIMGRLSCLFSNTLRKLLLS